MKTAMNKLMVFGYVTAGCGMMWTAWADPAPELPAGFTFTLECRSGSSTNYKIGFVRSTANCCPPYKVFRQKDAIVEIHFTNYDFPRCYTNDSDYIDFQYAQSWGDYYAHTTELTNTSGGSCISTGYYISTTAASYGAYDPTNNPDAVPEQWTGRSLTSCSWPNIWTNTKSCGGWTNTTYEPCTDTYYWGDAGFQVCTQRTSTDPYFPPVALDDWSTTVGCTNAIWYAVTNGPANFPTFASISNATNFSQEFTTPELIASLTTTITNEWVPCGRTSPANSISISEDQESAWGTAVQARFKIFAPEAISWWIEYYQVRNGTRIGTNTLSGLGTGDWEYRDVDVGSVAYTTYTSNGCVYYQGASAWIEVGPSSSGCALTAGCSSGNCENAAGSVNASMGSLLVTMGLGPTLFGNGRGSLMLAGSKPDPKLSTPAGLELFGDLQGADIVRATNGALCQVKALTCLADIVTNSSTNYQVNFYTSYSGPDSYGRYTGSNSPFSTITIAQGTSINQILVKAVHDASTNQYQFDWSADNQDWTLASGGGLREETLSWSTNGTTIISTRTIKATTGPVVYQESNHYETNYFPALTNYALLLSKQIVGTNAELTTQWFYYTNAQSDGTNFGKLKQIIEPSGFWKHFTYDDLGRLTKEISPFTNATTDDWQDTNMTRVIEYSYTPLASNCSSQTRVERLQGQEISREYTLDYGPEKWTIQCQTPEATLTAADNLVTITRYCTNADLFGELQSVSNSVGTMDIYQYATDGTNKTTTVFSGQPNTAGSAILNGTRTVTVVGSAGETKSRLTYNILTNRDDVLTSQEVYSYSDPLKRSYTVTYLDGTSRTVQYACCGIQSETDRDGTQTSYDYDPLKRRIITARNNITTTDYLDAYGNRLATTRDNSGTNVIVSDKAAYDTAGQICRATNALGGVTTYSASADTNGYTIRTTTYPDNGTRIETYHRDGTLKSITGTAVFPSYFDYGADSDGSWVQETKDTENGTEWVKTYTDMRGRSYKTVYPGNAYSQSFYNNYGQRWKERDPDSVATLYQYSAKGELEYRILDMDQNDSGTNAADRVTHYANGVADGYHRSLVYQTDEAGGEVLSSGRLVSFDGNTNITLSFELGTTNVTAYNPSAQQRTLTTIAPDGSYTLSLYFTGRLASVHRYALGGALLGTNSFGYDPHGRQCSITDSRTGTTFYGFNDADQITAVTTPPPGDGSPPQTTTTYFDNMGRQIGQLLPDGTTTTNMYHTNGLLKATWGSRTYPVGYSYDYAGRLKTMTNWATYPSTGARVTTWNYDVYRGWLTNKSYEGGAAGPIYTNTPAGRLAFRAWARSTNTVYTYNAAGDLSTVQYSDTTPGTTNTYDRRGRLATTIQGTMTTSRTYNDAGQLLSESFSGGSLSGLSVTNLYDAYLRRTNLSLWNGATRLTQTTNSYDAASRLEIVGDGVNTATYTYLTNSSLVGQIVFATNGTPVMTTSKQFDFLNQLRSISSSGSQLLSPISYAYAYNSANQRTRTGLADSSYWRYEYDSLGQVTSGKHYWSDGTQVLGQTFEYSFDDIGNRTQTKAAGLPDGSKLRVAYYTNNMLNQIVTGHVPGTAGCCTYMDVMGMALATNGVAFNGYGTYRKGEYYWNQLFVFDTATAPFWSEVTVSDGYTNVTGHQLLPMAGETLTYDADGNQNGDSIWTNYWDAENRLVKTEIYATNLPAEARLREDWSYLPDGRWTERTVSTNNGTNYLTAYVNRYIWDGQVLLAVLDQTNGVVMSFLRGLDLSGTMQGAGGVGGLLAVSFKTNGTHFAAYDGNGNVAALVSAADGKESARYDYGPFGEPIRVTGPVAKLNPIRFSTQYADDVRENVKYLHRIYEPRIGRWLSRDPKRELGNRNLYSFVKNEPIRFFDLLGLTTTQFTYTGEDGPAGVWITAGMEGINLCQKARIPLRLPEIIFKVHVATDASLASGPADFLAGTYTSDGSIQLNPANAVQNNPDEDNLSSFDLVRELGQPQCEAGLHAGSTSFELSYSGSSLKIKFDWSYNCDFCCKIRDPLSGPVTLSPGPGFQQK